MRALAREVLAALGCWQGVYLAPWAADPAAPAVGERVRLCDTSDLTQFSPNGRFLAVATPDVVQVYDPARSVRVGCPHGVRAAVCHPPSNPCVQWRTG